LRKPSDGGASTTRYVRTNNPLSSRPMTPLTMPASALGIDSSPLGARAVRPLTL
jgi:hypothetical protein